MGFALKCSPFRLPTLLLVLLVTIAVPIIGVLRGAELKYPIAVATAANGESA